MAPASQQAYLAGIKSYNKCLSEHGFKYAWTALTHETGDVYAYSYVSDPVSWADFDAMRTQGKACDATFQQQVNPHLKSESSAFIQEEAEMSHTTPKGMSGDLMEITYFKLKHGYMHDKTFVDMAKKIVLNRLGTPADVAQLVAFLACTEPFFITGQAFLVRSEDAGKICLLFLNHLFYVVNQVYFDHLYKHVLYS